MKSDQQECELQDFYRRLTIVDPQQRDEFGEAIELFKMWAANDEPSRGTSADVGKDLPAPPGVCENTAGCEDSVD